MCGGGDESRDLFFFEEEEKCLREGFFFGLENCKQLIFLRNRRSTLSQVHFGLISFHLLAFKDQPSLISNLGRTTFFS